MPGPQIDLSYWIERIADHTGPMPAESSSPIEHYRRGANDAYNLLSYFGRAANGRRTYKKPYERHAFRLRSLVLLAMTEAFERFLKELAALCVDQIGPLVTDDRLSVLRVHPRAVAAHFEEQTLGKALCEGDTWLDSDAIQTRFGKLLGEPFRDAPFKFFPTDRNDPDFKKRGTLDILWQLRHTIAHNVGVITRSDAAKLRLLRRAEVTAPTVLQLSSGDVWYAKLFLDDLVEWSNQRVADRVAMVLTLLHADDPSLFVPDDRARALAALVRVPVTVAGASAV